MSLRASCISSDVMGVQGRDVRGKGSSREALSMFTVLNLSGKNLSLRRDAFVCVSLWIIPLVSFRGGST